MWNSGPECSTGNEGEHDNRDVNAARTVICGSAARSAALPLSKPGARRIRKAAGSNSAQTATPIASWANRQSYVETSRAAMGATVMGATPMPAETSETSYSAI